MEVRLIHMIGWAMKQPEIIGYTPRLESAIGNEMCRWLACQVRDLNKEHGHGEYENAKFFMIGNVVEIADYNGKEVPEELYIVQEYIHPDNVQLFTSYEKACEIANNNFGKFLTVDQIKNIGEDYPDTVAEFVKRNIHKWR